METKQITYNKKAGFEYELLEKYETGIVLLGTEVKTIREGKCSISEAYVIDQDGELYIKGMNIPEYSHGNINNHEPKRLRKLILHKKEVKNIMKATNEKGCTIVPVSLYFKGSLIKVCIAVAKGKKLFDKRDTIKDRENARNLSREMKDFNN